MHDGGRRKPSPWRLPGLAACLFISLHGTRNVSKCTCIQGPGFCPSWPRMALQPPQTAGAAAHTCPSCLSFRHLRTYFITLIHSQVPLQEGIEVRNEPPDLGRAALTAEHRSALFSGALQYLHQLPGKKEV